MDNVLKITTDNPYRILGVYANSPKRDVVANKGRATAFLKVNRPVEYPLDLKGTLPPITRTLEMMNEAEAHLAIAREQIKYAQFWFLQKLSPLDDVAFNHLLAGNIAGAKEIWSKQETLSSLQNKLVCYLIDGKSGLAVKTAELLYEKFGGDYITKVDANCTLQMTATDLIHQFIDTLGEEIGMQKLLGYELSAETKAYISSQTVGPLISKISSEVDKTKKVDHKDPKARIEAARKLVASTNEPLAQLKSILPITDSQYQMIADKLGLEILQCGIDYFNNSKDEDKHKTAMKMQKHAQSIVVGTVAKQRCEENVKILQKIIDELPPKEIVKEVSEINNALATFAKGREKDEYDFLTDHNSHALTPVYTLLRETEKPLVAIRQKVGVDDDTYTKLSTMIARISLNKVIEVVNTAQNMCMGPLPLLSSKENLTSVLKTAWDLIGKIGEMDVTENFASHYQNNRNKLRKICNQVGIRTFEIGDISVLNIWEHIKSHQSSKWQAALIVNILGGLVGLMIYYMNNPYMYDVDEALKSIAWGIGIGAIAWLCILVDNDHRSGDWGDIATRGGCYGAILMLGLILFYWLYKIIRLAIDGFKGE